MMKIDDNDNDIGVDCGTCLNDQQISSLSILSFLTIKNGSLGLVMMHGLVYLPDLINI